MSVKLIRSPAVFARWCRSAQGLGLVPTMGALHEGHLSLLRRAKKQCRRVAVTIFVNPTQFGPQEDFSAYPRGLKKDLALLAPLQPAVVFAPASEAMYPSGFNSTVSVKGLLSSKFEGARRLGHFDGVATIVAKLFSLAGSGRAYFGCKDYQQLLIVKKMTRDLNLPVQVVACPTVREKDGLALSSRNAYLSIDQRRAAPALYRALRRASQALRSRKSPAAARREALSVLGKEKKFKLDYIEIADAFSLEASRPGEKKVVLGAAFLGNTRLIDNCL